MLNKNEVKALIIISVLYIYYSVFLYIPAFAPVKAGAVCLLWIMISLIYIMSPSARHNCKLKDEGYFQIVMVVFGVMYFITYFALGFVDGYGYSMYNNTVEGVIRNIALLGSVIVMREWVRDNLLNSVQKKYRAIFGILITVTFTFTEVNLYTLGSIETLREAVEYMCSDMLPKLATNAFLTYVVYIMGFKGAVIYSVLTRFPVWFFEYLPNLKWITLLILGVAYHIYCIIILNTLHLNHSTRGRRENKKSENPYSLLIICIIIVGLSWFTLGVFPLYPTNIVSNSMAPVIQRGDMVLINEVDYSQITVGDIILFRHDNVDVLHRVISAEEVGGEKILYTKGDANTIPDSQPITEGIYRGKHIYTIRYIGYPGIWVKQVNNDTITEINGE